MLHYSSITLILLLSGVACSDILENVLKELVVLKSELTNSQQRITQLEDRLYHADKHNIELEKRFDAFKAATKMDKRLEFSPTEVAFSTRLTKTLSGLKPHSTVKFDKVLIDTSSAYQNTTGVFTAPLTGVYVFTWVTAVQQYETTELLVNGVVHGYASADTANDGDPDYGSATQVVVIQVNKGQRVWIQAHHGSGFLDGRNDNTFSGWLLYSLE